QLHGVFMRPYRPCENTASLCLNRGRHSHACRRSSIGIRAFPLHFAGTRCYPCRRRCLGIRQKAGCSHRVVPRKLLRKSIPTPPVASPLAFISRAFIVHYAEADGAAFFIEPEHSTTAS